MTVDGAVGLKPLIGKRVVVTRARHQAASLVRLLEEAGAAVLAIPTIQIEPPETWDPLDRAIRELAAFRWVLFTSVNGVEVFIERMGRLGHPSGTLAQARIAAIGPATAQALIQWGCRPEVVPGEYRAEGLVECLRSEIRPGDGILIPRAAEARDLLVKALAELGARVREVSAYRTRPALGEADRLRQAFRRREIHAVTFTSSSTVRHFAELFAAEELRELLDGVVLACIGPITAETAAACGITPQVVAAEYTVPALAQALVAFYKKTG